MDTQSAEFTIQSSVRAGSMPQIEPLKLMGPVRRRSPVEEKRISFVTESAGARFSRAVSMAKVKRNLV